MARKNQEINGDASGKARPSAAIYASSSNSAAASSSPKKADQRLSPTRMPPAAGSSPGSSPRMSPGLLAGHYAGCKWSEPPLPSALPRPPPHWMPVAASLVARPFLKQTSQQPDVTYQLKVLLNVQA